MNKVWCVFVEYYDLERHYELVSIHGSEESARVEQERLNDPHENPYVDCDGQYFVSEVEIKEG